MTRDLPYDLPQNCVFAKSEKSYGEIHFGRTYSTVTRYRTFCKIGWYDFWILHSKIWAELKLSQGLQELQGPDLGTKIAIIFSKNSFRG